MKRLSVQKSLLWSGVGLLLLTGCRGARQPSNNLPSPCPDSCIRRELKIEMYKRAKVVAGEIVVKLDHCPADTKPLIESLTSVVSRVGPPGDQIRVSQVGNNCWFLIQSSTLTVTQLFDLLPRITPVTMVDPNTKEGTRIDHAEPNFVIQATTILAQDSQDG